MGAWRLEQEQGHEDETLQAPLLDLRFRLLVGREAWGALPLAVQQRFSKRLNGQAVALYRGRVVRSEFSRAGWLFAQVLRLVGAPLQISRDTDVPAVVSVSEDGRTAGRCGAGFTGGVAGFRR